MPKLLSKALIAISLLAAIGGFAAVESLKAGKPRPTVKTVSHPRTEFEFIRQADGEVIFEWQCPPLRLERSGPDSAIIGLDMDGAHPVFEVGVPRLPQLEQMLDCLPGLVDAQIVDADIETHALGAMLPTTQDVLIGDGADLQGYAAGFHHENDDGGRSTPSLDELRQITPLKEGLWPERSLDVREAGILRGHRLVNIIFHPVQVDARQGIARVMKRIRVRVTMPRNDTAVNRIPDRAGETDFLRRITGPLASTVQPTRMAEAFAGDGARESTLDDDPVYGAWKLIVDQEGIVRLTAEDLRFVGVPVEQISTLDLHISNHGQEIPIYFAGEADGQFNENDFIYFYGEINRGTFSGITPSFYQDYWTTENVYRLWWGDGRLGLRMGTDDGTWQTGPLWGPGRVRTQSSVRNTVHFEKDLVFDRLAASTYDRWTDRLQSSGPRSLWEDHWFWGDYINALTTRGLGITLAYPRSSLRFVGVRGALQGFSYGPLSENHRVMVSLNGITGPGLIVGKVSAGDNNIPWKGQTPIIVQNDVTDSVGIVNNDLQSGDNVISVSVTGDGLSGTRDKVFANWFEVDYDRELRAYTDYLKFRFDTTRGDTFSWDIRGFANRSIEVWKLGHSRLSGLDVRTVRLADEGTSVAVRFQLISDGGYDIIAFDDRYPRPPKAIIPEYGTRDLRTLPGAEYLIIYHDNFAADPALARLDSLRRVTFNGSVDTFRVSEIYDQFNSGIANPLAIHSFLQYAYTHWAVRPTHVCLIGDGLLNNRDKNQQSGNMISSIYTPLGEFGVVAADLLFGCVSGPPTDIIPDIAVGRISCRSPIELDTYVEKLVRYEDPNIADYSSIYHSNFLFVADDRDDSPSQPFNFDRDFSELAIRVMPDMCNVSRVYLDSLGSGQGPNVLRSAFRDGAIMANYNGHGGGGVWSGSNLMTVPGVSQLNNARDYPFITNFTCYVGAFDARSQAEVLGEAFLFARNLRLEPVGGIGVYANSTLSYAYTGVAMQTRLFNFVSEPPGMTLGEIVQQNKTLFWGQQGLPSLGTPAYSMIVAMNLLGDPGVHLKVPQQQWETIHTDRDVARSGDTLYVSGTLPWDPQGNITRVFLLPYNDNFVTRLVEWVPNRRVFDTVATNRSHVPAFNTGVMSPVIVRTQQFDSLAVRLPAGIGHDFVAARGYVVAYAVDPGREGQPPRDAITTLTVFNTDSVNSLRITDIRPWPKIFVPQDSAFRIQAELIHPDEILSVRMRGIFRPAQGPVVLDTVEMVSLGSGLWQSPDLPPRDVFGGEYRVQLTIRTVGGELINSADYTMPLESRGDFALVPGGAATPAIIPGNQPLFQIPVWNGTSSSEQQPAELGCRLIGVRDSTYRITSFPPRDTTVVVDSFAVSGSIADPAQQPPLFYVYLPAQFRAGSYRITITLDPDSLIRETNETNNRYTAVLSPTSLLPATNLLGSYMPRFTPQQSARHRFWPAGKTDTVQVSLLPGSLATDSTTLIFSSDTLTPATLARYAGAGLTPPVSGQTVQTFHITLADSSERLASSGRVRIAKNFSGLLDSTSALTLGIFLRQNGSDTWWRLQSQLVEYVKRDTIFPPGGGVQYRWSGRISGESPVLGTVGIFRSTDGRGPDITFGAHGLVLTRGSILPRRPDISINLNDVSGIDRSAGRFLLVLDNDTVTDAEMAWSDTVLFGSGLCASIRPELEPGSHLLWCKARDNLGNTDSAAVDFEVRGEFGIDWAIAFPNPFARSVTIGYLLTDVTDQFVELKIFTVSGRCIRTINEQELAVANYRQLQWDGADERGEEVANGVYFARIKAKQGNQEVEKIVKMAKVR